MRNTYIKLPFFVAIHFKIIILVEIYYERLNFVSLAHIFICI